VRKYQDKRGANESSLIGDGRNLNDSAAKQQIMFNLNRTNE
jgi:hypothetical protein